ncbi:MAG: ComEC/Rec2 family competence protein, partial [Gammaproteobacteria bacterium]
MPALALSVLVGTLAGLWIPTWTAFLPTGLLLTLAPALWWLGGRLPLAALIGFVGAELAAHDYQGSVLADERQPADILVTGIISDFPRATSRGYDFTFDLTAGTFPATGLSRLRLATYDYVLRPAAGELWQLKVRLKPPHGHANPGTFDRA